jgi:hypothetical protein
MTYCGECQTAIDEALKNIPQKISRDFLFVEDEKEKERLNGIFDAEKNAYEKSDDFFPRFIPIVLSWDYDKVERCYIDDVEYYRCTKTNGEIDFKQSVEYDLIENKITNVPYVNYNNDGNKHYTPVHIAFRHLPAFDFSIPVKPLDPPKDNLNYLNISL